MMRTETPPLVSIGMPVYNGEKTIRQSIDSLLAQDFKDFELIISDNASTDSTGNICQQYTARDPRIRYYRNETNIGPIANFNCLAHLACGKYFMWAADDDLWEPSFVSCTVDALDKNPDAVLSFCRFDSLSTTDKEPVIDKDNWEGIIGHGRFYRLFWTCFLMPAAANRACYIYGLIRKDILLGCGGTETRVNAYNGADIVTLFHLLYYGKFVKVDKLLYHKRYNSDRWPLHESLFQKLAHRSFYSLMITYLKMLSKWHQHYNVLRVIVKENSLPSSHKIILFMMLCIAELLFYFDNILHTSEYWVTDYLKHSK